MASFLPLRRWYYLGPRVFGVRDARDIWPIPELSSPALRRHLERLAPMLAAVTVCLRSSQTNLNSTSHKLWDPSAYLGRRCPTFHSLRGERPDRVALRSEGAVLRVWLPSLRFQQPPSARASFSPRRSWVSLFEALFLPEDRVTGFQRHSPLLQFRERPFDLSPLLQRLAPFREAVPHYLLPRGLARVGAACFLELYDLSGSPFGRPT